jgi:hypothetical protein
MLRYAAAAALALAAAPAASQAPPPASPGGTLFSNGWYYEEIGNGCMAGREVGDARLIIRLTRWNDLSDSLLFHRPGLAPLWSEEGYSSGLTPAQEEAEGRAGHHLTIRIDGRPVEMVSSFSTMLLDLNGRPGPTYRFGLRQHSFLRALRTGRTLELFHRGRRLASFPIRGSAELARRMTRCIDLPLAR